MSYSLRVVIIQLLNLLKNGTYPKFQLHTFFTLLYFEHLRVKLLAEWMVDWNQPPTAPFLPLCYLVTLSPPKMVIFTWSFGYLSSLYFRKEIRVRRHSVYQNNYGFWVYGIISVWLSVLVPLLGSWKFPLVQSHPIVYKLQWQKFFPFLVSCPGSLLIRIQMRSLNMTAAGN